MMIDFENGNLTIQGDLTVHQINYYSERFNKIISHHDIKSIDLTAILTIDSAGVAFIDEIITICKKQNSNLNIVKANTVVQSLIDTFSSLTITSDISSEEVGFFERIGNAVIINYENIKETLVIAADIFFWSFWGIINHKGQHKSSFVQQSIILGVQALPIIILMSFIIGFILSLQSAAQLKNFGANVFIADLLAVSLVREMGPLMTAVIVAGRSGSSIASEIATMKVSEEIDALRMMAINPIRYVVVPKFHAISVLMPMLVVIFIMIAEIGGLIIAVGYLDLSLTTFVSRSLEILTIKDIVISLSKSIFFAWVIVIIGSYYGFQVKGGAEGVGKATTASVVASIFAVIFFDALFSLLYL